MSRAERRREMRGQEKKEVARVMTIAQIQQMKKDMADLIADELVEPGATSADFHFASEQPTCSTPGVEFPHAASRMEFKPEGAFSKTACQIEPRA